MSKQINVRGLVPIIDTFYRYKMPSIIIVNQKTKYVITNMNELAQSLQRDPNMIIDYLKKKFSVSMTFNKDLNTVEFKGIQIELIQEAVYEFIEYYVLCPSCRNPETVLSNKKSIMYIKCNACSHNDKLKSTASIVNKTVDMIIKYV